MIDGELYEAVRCCISGGDDEWDAAYNDLVTCSPTALARLIDALQARLAQLAAPALEREGGE